ncbi:hypothetical protein BCV73_10515 [Paenibacillus sp. SSG-1]|nr:hypothetical protein BCV73_10515 [Paenibacillus sp. SSG-1]
MFAKVLHLLSDLLFPSFFTISKLLDKLFGICYDSDFNIYVTALFPMLAGPKQAHPFSKTIDILMAKKTDSGLFSFRLPFMAIGYPFGYFSGNQHIAVLPDTYT